MMRSQIQRMCSVTPGLVELMRGIRAIVSFCPPSVEPRYLFLYNLYLLNPNHGVVVVGVTLTGQRNNQIKYWPNYSDLQMGDILPASVEPRYPVQMAQPKLNRSDAVVGRFYVLEKVL